MAENRTTFHEAWYRVSTLKPRLQTGVNVHRQRYRGVIWFVVENTINNQYTRISEHSWQFIAKLDGHLTVNEAWQQCNDALGDYAPTQSEAIQLLGQLHTSNLIYSEITADTESLFERYQQRIKRQITGTLTNILFVKIPLFDPDKFLTRWQNLTKIFFSKFAFLIWTAVIAMGIFSVISQIDILWLESSKVLAGLDLIYLFMTFVVIKVCHEFGHAFACKHFGEPSPNKGQVHSMGIMFLVFAPIPFVDASSAWSIRNKRHRAIVGAAGIYVELFIAAICAMIWANTAPGLLHKVAYQVIFVASVSTVLFNGNPLLRFDAYYILTDLIEIPNLSMRSKNYVYYLFKRFVWGMHKLSSMVNTTSERWWLGLFGIASTIYRIFICIQILLYLNDRLPEELFIIVPIMAGCSLVMWLIVPCIKLWNYLFNSTDVMRYRLRAVSTTFTLALLLFIGLGVIPIQDHCRIEGVVEPKNMATIYTDTEGYLNDFLPSGESISPTYAPLIKQFNPELITRKNVLKTNRIKLDEQINHAQYINDQDYFDILQEQSKALDEQITRNNQQLDQLNIHAPLTGLWVSPDIEHRQDSWIARGSRVGYVVNTDQMEVRGVAQQQSAALLSNKTTVEIRAHGRPSVTLNGMISKINPAGQSTLPSQALGYAVGGEVETESNDHRGLQTTQQFFEIRVQPESQDTFDLLTGQRVVVRCNLTPKPLAMQWYRSLRQLFQRRFNI